ncbi:MAG: type II secretion system protein M [Mojavia pulchra JT2-VF2]|jgi:type IV pilus assembly protein PilO|uniref:Type II secretion system protein M n=1 Tax=Mojavia pulchra JT2-VF2 TaxID=287848 RepID=A0A951UF14_9NOST|nr:type II secretion system protein M [Mojavia pulchra JT2-VF2]
MTLSEDFNFAEQSGEFDSESSGSPVIFGITFTPKIIGIVAGVLGIAGALYMLLNLIMPAWDNYQQQQAKINELQGQVDQKKISIKKIVQVKEELDHAKQQRIQVLSLFSQENTLDTLLLDMNRLIETGNGQISPNLVRAKLKKFAPATQKTEAINDGSLGAQVNGKLKRSSVNIEIVGTYEQTQSILRNIERLQPLLIVKDYQSQLAPSESTSASGKPVQRIGPASINTTFQLQALMPLSPEEIAAASAKAAPKK